eukprot:TRINITY_DN43740_c0_g1_i1.p1 TRINITY_DN43740_c0_g1~~TRINITY_DN43740_c0_g1_i1.p1  ORF type:complete len:674 (+),score=101.55 TRINITY_DN43740_c0_g1_i1:88-2109(+)
MLAHLPRTGPGRYHFAEPTARNVLARRWQSRLAIESGSPGMQVMTACVAGVVALRRRQAGFQRMARTCLGPTAAWDTTGGPAVQQLSGGGGGGPDVVPGHVNRVIWMCWTGNNPIPPHLQLCVKTIQRNSNLPVVIITPSNLLQYVPNPHPAYSYLHLQHRADYLRCRLLHQYGGIYLDMDTIVLRDLSGLFDLLHSYDAVGYDGSQWGELIGISDMGPFRPFSDITSQWYNTIQGKLDQALGQLQQQNVYPFYWQEILRDIFVPISVAYRDRVTAALQAYNPEKEELWSVGSAQDLLGAQLAQKHLLILNNSKYGSELVSLTEEQLLNGPAVLSQIWRQALGLTQNDEPAAVRTHEPPLHEQGMQQGRTANAASGLPLTVGVGTCQVHTECQVPPDMMETFKQIGAPGHFLISVQDQLDWAFKAGCRLVDTAQRYGNEDGVGKAVRKAIEEGTIRRDELFITTKIEVKNMGYETTLRSFEESRIALQLDQVDLLLLHFPPAPELRQETWAAMEQLVKEGKVKHIGVANHSERHIEDLMAYAQIPPAVNQIEIHPYHAQFQLANFCIQRGIAVMGYSPLGGRGAAGKDTGVTDDLLSDPTILEVARAYGKTPAQVILRWALQRGITPIPKAASPERLSENLSALLFELADADMDKISGLDRGQFVVCDVQRLA